MFAWRCLVFLLDNSLFYFLQFTIHIFISSNLYAYYFFFFIYYTGSNFFIMLKISGQSRYPVSFPFSGERFQILSDQLIWITIEFLVDMLIKIMEFLTVPDLLTYLITHMTFPFLLMHFESHWLLDINTLSPWIINPVLESIILFLHC